MVRIGLMGVTWRQGGPDLLARFTVPVDERPDWLLRCAREANVTELVYLATCNRVEMVFVGDGTMPVASFRTPLFQALTGRPPEPGEAIRALQGWRGERAAEHLFLVSSGLDSVRVGEAEICGQVRQAYDLSRELGLTGPRLDLLFEEGLKVARRVHAESRVGQGRESLAEIALDHLRARLRRTPGSVAVIGVSSMTERCTRALADDGCRVVIVNRSLERAESLANKVGATARDLGAFREHPDPVEAVLLATGAPHPILSRANLERLAAVSPSGESPLAVDMAIPPDVSPEDAELAGVDRVGMEEILAEAERNREQRLIEAADAREFVDEALQGLRRRMIDRVLAPLLAAVQRRYRQTAHEGVDRLFRKELSGLGDTERAAVRRWAETLARRFAHLPTTGLRGLAYSVGPSAVEAFLEPADKTMVALLREAANEPDAFTLSEGHHEI